MSEPLKPLGIPADYAYSRQEHTVIGWHTWSVESHLSRLYIRCDALLEENQRLAARVEALETAMALLQERVESLEESRPKLI